MTEATPRNAKLGTFLGVFTPTVLTVLGVILFLRVGWLTAVGGIWGELAIVMLSNIITLKVQWVRNPDRIQKCKTKKGGDRYADKCKLIRARVLRDGDVASVHRRNWEPDAS